MSYLQAVQLCKRYGSGDAAVEAVRDVSLSAEPGEFVAVMGESGSGKSTLLSMLGALNSPTQGRYAVGGVDIYALGPERRADFRRENLGFVFQSFHLLPYLSVAENVMLPLVTSELSRGEKRRLADEALSRVGLGGKGRRLPSEVSGGEAERAAIARALVNRPPLVLADEPTGNLDSRTGREVMELLAGLSADGVTIVMVTHSRDCASFARRILHMADGRVVNEEFLVHEVPRAVRPTA
jgi:putative ABC transport system ATP-binding protein